MLPLGWLTMSALAGGAAGSSRSASPHALSRVRHHNSAEGRHPGPSPDTPTYPDRRGPDQRPSPPAPSRSSRSAKAVWCSLRRRTV